MKKAKSKSAKKTKAATPLDAVPDRKIVQISATTGGEHWLLCDDGTVWMGGPGSWSQVNIDQVLIEVVPAAEHKS